MTEPLKTQNLEQWQRELERYVIASLIPPDGLLYEYTVMPVRPKINLNFGKHIANSSRKSAERENVIAVSHQVTYFPVTGYANKAA